MILMWSLVVADESEVDVGVLQTMAVRVSRSLNPYTPCMAYIYTYTSTPFQPPQLNGHVWNIFDLNLSVKDWPREFS